MWWMSVEFGLNQILRNSDLCCLQWPDALSCVAALIVSRTQHVVGAMTVVTLAWALAWMEVCMAPLMAPTLTLAPALVPAGTLSSAHVSALQGLIGSSSCLSLLMISFSLPFLLKITCRRDLSQLGLPYASILFPCLLEELMDCMLNWRFVALTDWRKEGTPMLSDLNEDRYKDTQMLSM